MFRGVYGFTPLRFSIIAGNNDTVASTETGLTYTYGLVHYHQTEDSCSAFVLGPVYLSTFYSECDAITIR